MDLIKKLLWVVLFAICTFAFTVLFEYGTTDYAKNFTAEFKVLKEMVAGDKDAKPKTP